MIGNMVTVGGGGGESKGLTLGWDPTLSLVLALVGTTLLGMLFGAVASRSFGIYFLMITLTFSVITFYFVGQVTVVSGFSGIGGINSYTPGFVGDIVNDRYRLYYIALVSRSSSTASSATSCARRSASRCRGSGTSTCG